MVGEASPHNVCGQILFCLKMCNLNCLVKETPYSAYVTIRKKFIPSVRELERTRILKKLKRNCFYLRRRTQT